MGHGFHSHSQGTTTAALSPSDVPVRVVPITFAASRALLVVPSGKPCFNGTLNGI